MTPAQALDVLELAAQQTSREEQRACLKLQFLDQKEIARLKSAANVLGENVPEQPSAKDLNAFRQKVFKLKKSGMFQRLFAGRDKSQRLHDRDQAIVDARRAFQEVTPDHMLTRGDLEKIGEIAKKCEFKLSKSPSREEILNLKASSRDNNEVTPAEDTFLKELLNRSDFLSKDVARKINDILGSPDITVRDRDRLYRATYSLFPKPSLKARIGSIFNKAMWDQETDSTLWEEVFKEKIFKDLINKYYLNLYTIPRDHPIHTILADMDKTSIKSFDEAMASALSQAVEKCNDEEFLNLLKSKFPDLGWIPEKHPLRLELARSNYRAGETLEIFFLRAADKAALSMGKSDRKDEGTAQLVADFLEKKEGHQAMIDMYRGIAKITQEGMGGKPSGADDLMPVAVEVMQQAKDNPNFILKLMQQRVDMQEAGFAQTTLLSAYAYLGSQNKIAEGT